jgi:Acyl-CoA reductase (LuxC)
MTSATERLMGLAGADDCFDVAPADLLAEQLAAANERLDSQIGQIGLLANRAESAEVKQIKKPADLVPLLFAADTTVFNQEACLASRYAFVEGEPDQLEAFCAELAERLNVDREFASAVGPALTSEVRGEVQVMEAVGDLKVWGGFDGRGLVILSDRPVEFHPSNKTSNVVMVPSLDDAVR